jgi:hypothetical protein
MRILEIPVQPDITNLITYYQQIKVYRASTYDGTYSLVGTITLVADQSLYPFVDNSGLLTDVYKFSYYKTTGPVESDKYDLPSYYSTVQALKDRIDDGEVGTDDRNFIDAAAAATDAINRYCGRRFNQVIETRYFEGSPSRGFYIGKGSQILYVDDFVSVSGITITGDDAIDYATEVYPLPENAQRLDWPYMQLALKPAADKEWPTGYHAIAITATWGWPVNPITQSSVPAAVKEAAIEVALRLYKGKDNSYARVVGQNDLGATKVTDDLMNGDTRALLAPYVRKC